MEEIARQTYEGKLKRGELDAGHVLMTYRELNKATGTGYGKNWLKINKDTGAPAPEALRMQQNLYRFSGAKNFAMLEEINRLLTNDGKLANWEDFRSGVLQLNDKYNVNHLQAEWQTAKQGGYMANLWQEYEGNTKLYPNLRYRTQGDKHVRDEHRKLEGVIAPVNSSFWDSYYPPNGWRCRCYVVQTAEPATNENELPEISPQDVAPEFKNNVGKGGEVFKETGNNKGKPHPYFALAKTPEIKKTIERLHLNQLKADAKEKLLGISIKHPELDKKIEFNKTGFKEAFNQPHSQKEDKNLIIPYMDTVLPNSEYLGFSLRPNNNPMIAGSHIFRVMIEGKPSYIVIRERVTGELFFYSISDNENVTKDLVKK